MDFKGAVIGDNAVIRSNSTIYSEVKAGITFERGTMLWYVKLQG